MRKKLLTLGGTIAALAVGEASTATAQRVSADIHVASGPVAGTIHIGDRYDGYYGRPRRAGVLVRRDFPRVIVVERHGRRRDFRPGRDARLVVAYFDRDCGIFFDRYRRGLVAVRLFEHKGRFYRASDRDGDWRDDRDRRERRDWPDRYDRDRRFDRDDDDDDYGRWEHDHRH
jgi:hypothetical protein